jgi:hypothetical protein
MQFVNDVFEEFADCFVGDLERGEDIAHPAKLNRDSLDFSVESLKNVDKYLDYLFKNRPQRMGKEWVNTILWGGAYVGEVIRRNAPRQYDWVDFDDWIREYPEQVQLLGDRKDLQVCAFITPGQGAFTLPLNKVHKFIANGPEDSVRFYAACEVREQ